MGFQRHSLELRMGKQFLLHSLVQRHSLIHKEQRFQRHSLGQRHNLIHMEQPFQRRTMDQQPMYHSKSSKLRSRVHRANDAKGRHQSFGRKG
jgi:hypothetical protein